MENQSYKTYFQLAAANVKTPRVRLYVNLPAPLATISQCWSGNLPHDSRTPQVISPMCATTNRTTKAMMERLLRTFVQRQMRPGQQCPLALEFVGADGGLIQSAALKFITREKRMSVFVNDISVKICLRKPAVYPAFEIYNRFI